MNVRNFITTGNWQAALDGAATGFITGTITGAISGAVSSPYCFVAGTTVLTAAGAAAIETIEVGDYVWAWDENTKEYGKLGCPIHPRRFNHIFGKQESILFKQVYKKRNGKRYTYNSKVCI